MISSGCYTWTRVIVDNMRMTMGGNHRSTIWAPNNGFLHPKVKLRRDGVIVGSVNQERAFSPPLTAEIERKYIESRDDEGDVITLSCVGEQRILCRQFGEIKCSSSVPGCSVLVSYFSVS